MDKKAARQRRAQRARARIRTQGIDRLCVHRTPRHIYAQVIGDGGGKIVVAASTLDPQVREEIKNGGNVSAATVVGRVIAERAKAAGVQKVAFDRSGFRYHGRLRALADAAREHGLEF